MNPLQIIGKYIQSDPLLWTCVLDSNNRFIDANLPWQRTTDKKKDDLIGQEFLDHIHRDYLVNVQDALRRAHLGNGTIVLRARIQDAHDIPQFLLLHAGAVAEGDAVVLVGMEVTEEMLSLSEASLFESVLDEHAIVSRTDARGTITYVNDLFCTISGYDANELLGRNHRVVNSGLHPPSFFKEMWKTVASGETWHGEICNLKKDGGYYWVDSTIMPEMDINGSITGYISLRTDITKIKQAMQEIQEQSRELRETQALAKVGGWRLMAQSMHARWTPEVFHIHEIPVAKGVSWQEALVYFIPQDRIRIKRTVEEALSVGKPFSEEYQIKTARHNERVVRVTGEVEREDGKIIALRGLYQDVTEVREAESRAEIERRNAMQSGRLALIGQMAAGIAHEINNPLAVIDGFAFSAQRALQKGDTDKAVDRIKKMSASVERIARIVKGLRRFARDESAGKFEDVQLDAVVENSLEFCAQRCRNRGVKIERIENPDVMVSGNAVELLQVAVNLVTNACDAVEDIDERWIRIEVSVLKNHGLISVENSGKRLALDIAEKVFDPFYTNKGGNTGLGLSVCRGIVENHNGEIFFDESAEHTRFVVRIPMLQAV
jgi:PAS domain S-box-containing protein